MRKCVIHIGTTKTGSTAIQLSLSESVERLRANGIDYPGGNQNYLASALFGLPVKREHKRDQGISGLEDFLAATRADLAIVSAERLSNHRVSAEQARALVDVVRAKGFEPLVVAFVRPPPSLANSEYVQAVMNFQRDEAFAPYAEAMRGNAHFRFATRLAAWSDGAGAPFVAVPYGAQGVDEFIGDTFLRACGVEQGTVNAVALARTSGNRSLGPLAVGAFRHALRIIRRRSEVAIPHRVASKAQRFAERRGWNKESFCGFDAAAARAFDELVAEDNERFASRWWNRSWHDVFARDYARASSVNEVDIDRLDAETARAYDDFAASLAKQYPDHF